MDDARLGGRRDASGLIGRAEERTRLRSFLARALEDGDALLLTGDPGVGKTALLDAAARGASTVGAQVLRADGVEFEGEVSFSGLNQLLLPLLGEMVDLPAPHREALAVALGLGTGAAPDRLVVSAASLGLLGLASRRRPVLLAVDDLPWLDRSTTGVLGFLARRLGGSRVGLVATARTESDCFLLHAGLPRIDVPPLGEDAASALLHARFAGLLPAVRSRVLSAAQGNPLALVELPAAMSEGQRRGAEPLPSFLRMSHHLEHLFTDRVAGLPAATRRLLLLAALDGTGDLRSLRAATPDDSWLDDLAPAERERLVHVDVGTDRVRLGHPLIGSAAVDLATSGERRRAHRALADVLVDQPERRAWHLAESVVGPDARAADLVELAAHRALQKGDAVRAVDAFLRSAHLSPTGADRARRLADAAFLGADATGELRSVPRLLHEARSADPDTTASLEVAVAAAHHLVNGEGDVETAHLMLVRAVEHALEQGHGAGTVENALHSLVLVCHFSGRSDPWQPLERALTALGADVPSLLTVSAGVLGDPARATTGQLDGLDTLISTANADVDPTRIVRVAIAAFYADRVASCRQALWRVVQDGRDGGAAASAVNALMMLCHEALVAGRWDEAHSTAEEGVAWGERLGYRLVSLPGVYCLGLLAAARGDDAATRRAVDDLVAWSVPRGVTLFQHFAHRIRGLAASGRGDFEAAYRHLTAISPAGTLAAHVPVAVSVAPDLVEAAVRTGRSGEAAAHVAAMRRAPVFTVRPRTALLAACSAALVAPPEDAADEFERALALPGAELYPFDRARVRLAYGEHLRRTRATGACRTQLSAARETFLRLGAQPWVARSENELRAAGVDLRTAAGTGSTLTAQEHEIASLAAAGLTNKQIGSRLYLSPRTVAAHLYRVFPKLGVGSRAALRDALTRDPAVGTRPPDASGVG